MGAPWILCPFCFLVLSFGEACLGIKGPGPPGFFCLGGAACRGADWGSRGPRRGGHRGAKGSPVGAPSPRPPCHPRLGTRGRGPLVMDSGSPPLKPWVPPPPGGHTPRFPFFPFLTFSFPTFFWGHPRFWGLDPPAGRFAKRHPNGRHGFLHLLEKK